MEFTLLNKKKELVISTLISSTTNGITRSIVYITLRVNNRAKKNYQVKNSVQWLYHSCLIIDEINMINLPLLILIDTQLQKTRKSSLGVIIICGRLSLVILRGDFYQFVPVQKKAFWNKVVGKKKLHGKSFYIRFTIILILTK